MVLIMATSLLTVHPVSAPPAPPEYHGPIVIDGNGGFTGQNGVISGNGTASDPYIIEGWVIYSPEENAIDVRDTDAYFTIRNSIVSSDNPGHPTGCGLLACSQVTFAACVLELQARKVPGRAISAISSSQIFHGKPLASAWPNTANKNNRQSASMI